MDDTSPTHRNEVKISWTGETTEHCGRLRLVAAQKLRSERKDKFLSEK